MKKKSLLSLAICAALMLPGIAFATYNTPPPPPTPTPTPTPTSTQNQTQTQTQTANSAATATASPTATATTSPIITTNPTATSTANGGNATGGSATTGPVSNTNNNAANVLGSGNSDNRNTNTLTNGSNTATNTANGGTGIGIGGLGGQGGAGGLGGSASSSSSSNSNSASNASNGNMTLVNSSLSIPSHVIAVAPSFTPSSSVSMSGTGCGPLQSVVKTAVTGVFLGLLSNDNVALGTDEELAPYTENGVVKYFHELKNGTKTMLMGHSPMLSAAVLTTSGARQFSLGGNAVSGAGGSGAAGQSSGMQQQTMKIKLASCVFDIQDSAAKAVVAPVAKEVGLNAMQKAEILALMPTPQMVMTPRLAAYMEAETPRVCVASKVKRAHKAKRVCK